MLTRHLEFIVHDTSSELSKFCKINIMKPIFFPSMCILSTEIYFISHEIVYFCTKLLNSNSMFILKCRLIGRRNYSKLESGRFAFHILWFFGATTDGGIWPSPFYSKSVLHCIVHPPHPPPPKKNKKTHTLQCTTVIQMDFKLTSIYSH